MRSARSRFLLSAFLLVPASFAILAFAAEENPGKGPFSNEFEGIKTRLEVLEQKQKDVLTEKEKILDEIDQLKVWVRHSGGSKSPVG